MFQGQWSLLLLGGGDSLSEIRPYFNQRLVIGENRELGREGMVNVIFKACRMRK